MARVIRTRKQRRAAIRDGYRFGLPRPTREEYAAYLLGKWWQMRRLQKLRASRWECERCGRGDRELHVHHLHYCSLGREKNIDLAVLCVECHKKEHPNWR